MNIEDFIAQNKNKIEIIGGEEENMIPIEETIHYELENVICFEDKEKFTGKLILTNLYDFLFQLNSCLRYFQQLIF